MRPRTFAKRYSLRRGLLVSALAGGMVTSSFAAAPVVNAQGLHRHHHHHHNARLAAELHRLRMCESGDNYHANTGNGYYGAYQFALGTWHGLGFGRRPDLAKPAIQDRAARRLHARGGWGAWPACSRREHLR